MSYESTHYIQTTEWIFFLLTYLISLPPEIEQLMSVCRSVSPHTSKDNSTFFRRWVGPQGGWLLILSSDFPLRQQYYSFFPLCGYRFFQTNRTIDTRKQENFMERFFSRNVASQHTFAGTYKFQVDLLNLSGDTAICEIDIFHLLEQDWPTFLSGLPVFATPTCVVPPSVINIHLYQEHLYL